MRAAVRSTGLALLLCVIIQTSYAAAQPSGRGDRFMNSGQGAQRATDKCTFVYKARTHTPQLGSRHRLLLSRGRAGRRWL